MQAGSPGRGRLNPVNHLTLTACAALKIHSKGVGDFWQRVLTDIMERQQSMQG